ncbi:MAG: HEAT repeat domain-containing protein, partial [Planctomycetota bacterium]|nr:HEAT repeat domain-containing protein [Planctomycetota bacterium]
MSRVLMAFSLSMAMLYSQAVSAQDQKQKKKVERALNSLQSTRSKDRCRGLQQLAILGRADPAIIKALGFATIDLSEEVRVSTAQALKALVKHSATHSLLFQLCRDESAAVRIEASAVLALLPNSDKRSDAFLELLSDRRSLVLIRTLYDIQLERRLTLPLIERVLKLGTHSHPMVRLRIPSTLLKTNARQFEQLLKSFESRSADEQDLLRKALLHSNVLSPWVYEYVVSLLKQPQFQKAVRSRLLKAGVRALPALVQEYKRTKKDEEKEVLDSLFDAIIDKQSKDGFSEEMIEPLVYSMIFGHEDYAYLATDALAYDSEIAGKAMEQALTTIAKIEGAVEVQELMKRLESIIADKSRAVLLQWAKKKKCVAALMAANLLDYFDYEGRPAKDQIQWGIQSKSMETRELAVNLLSAQAHGEYFVLNVLKKLILSKDDSLRTKATQQLSDLARSFRPAKRFLHQAAFSRDLKLKEMGLRFLPKTLLLKDDVIQSILKQIKNDDGELRDVAIERLSGARWIPAKWTAQIQALTKNENTAVRCAALRALCQQERVPESSREILLKSLIEPDSSVRTTASRSLAALTITRAETEALTKRTREFAEIGATDTVKDMLLVFIGSQNSDDIIVTLFKELVEVKEYHSSIDWVLAKRASSDRRYVGVLARLLEMSYLTGQTVTNLARIGPDCLVKLNAIYDRCNDGAKSLILMTVAQFSRSSDMATTLIGKGLRGTSLVKAAAWQALTRQYEPSEAYGQLLKLAIEDAFPATPEIVKSVKPQQRLVFESLLKCYDQARNGQVRRRVLEGLSYCQVDRSSIAAKIISDLNASPSRTVLRLFERVDKKVQAQLLKLSLAAHSPRQIGALTVLAHILKSGGVDTLHGELNHYVKDLVQSIRASGKKELRAKKLLVLSYMKESANFDEKLYQQSLNELPDADKFVLLNQRPASQFSNLEEALFCKVTEASNKADTFDQFCHAYALQNRLSSRVRRTLVHFSKNKVKSTRVRAYGR